MRSLTLPQHCRLVSWTPVVAAAVFPSWKGGTRFLTTPPSWLCWREPDRGSSSRTCSVEKFSPSTTNGWEEFTEKPSLGPMLTTSTCPGVRVSSTPCGHHWGTSPLTWAPWLWWSHQTTTKTFANFRFNSPPPPFLVLRCVLSRRPTEAVTLSEKISPALAGSQRTPLRSRRSGWHCPCRIFNNYNLPRFDCAWKTASFSAGDVLIFTNREDPAGWEPSIMSVLQDPSHVNQEQDQQVIIIIIIIIITIMMMSSLMCEMTAAEWGSVVTPGGRGGTSRLTAGRSGLSWSSSSSSSWSRFMGDKFPLEDSATKHGLWADNDRDNQSRTMAEMKIKWNL